MARTKQTARRSTGSVQPNQSQPMQTEPRVCIQASSTDPPLAPGEFGYRMYQLVAQYADDDLTREAQERYADEVVPKLTGRSSRKRKADCIAVLKKQILMEREYSASQATEAAEALLSLAPTQVEPIVQAQAQAPEPPAIIGNVIGNKRNRGSLKTGGGVSYNKPQPNTSTPGTWVASYRCFRKSGFNTKAQADAKLAYWKDNDLCPCCEKPDADQAGIPATEYRFRTSDPATDLIVLVNGKEYRIPGGGEYVIRI